MAPHKRAGEAKVGRPKKSRTQSAEPVVEAIGNSDALAADLRTLFRGTLANVLQLNKADRHPYEVEVVAEAEKSLGMVQASLEESHSAALSKQNEITGAEEKAKRVQGKKSAEADLEAAKSKLETIKEAQNAAHEVVREAKSALKAAKKDAASVEKEVQTINDKKAHFTGLLETQLVLISEGTSATPEGKDAVKSLAKAGKECNLDTTLLSTFPLTAKKEPSTRSDFDTMMLGQLKTGIEKHVAELTQKQAELEPSNAEKAAAVEAASAKVAKADEALAAASKELSEAQDAQKAAEKEFAKADNHLYEIWKDMKLACDEQDALADELQQFKEAIMTTFNKLKDKEPEAEAEEPEEEKEGEAAEEAAPMETEAANNAAGEEVDAD